MCHFIYFNVKPKLIERNNRNAAKGVHRHVYDQTFGGKSRPHHKLKGGSDYLRYHEGFNNMGYSRDPDEKEKMDTKGSICVAVMITFGFYYIVIMPFKINKQAKVQGEVLQKWYQENEVDVTPIHPYKP